MSDILDDLKMLADHCDQENGDEPCDLGMLLIRAIGEIRKLRSQPVSAAEVPMPEPVAYLYTLEYGETVVNKKVSMQQLNYPFGVCGADYLARNDNGCSYVKQTPLYTTAREAAGYARGLKEAMKDVERYRFLRKDFSPMGLDIDCNHAWAYRRNATLKGPNLDAAIDAALCGEVKP